MEAGELIFIVVSALLGVALIVAIWKLGESVPAWVIDLAQAGAGVGYEYALGTDNKIDDGAWEDIIARLDRLELDRTFPKDTADGDTTTPKDGAG